MFLGKYRHNLDAKGRLAIPAKFREQLPSGSVVTIGPDGALRVYPPGEWAEVTATLKLGEATSPTERALVRRLFAEAGEVEFDGQGRVLIPAGLRSQAGIAGTAVVSGANNLVEIWSEARWEALEAETADFTHLADEVARARTQRP
ncbi:MAG TPA: division/cell wall cluster transcriptional repressor MraZ [Candidatus Dormibacteraeota bacterium]|jgi:MraZ protein|nr:division/cell wall cluster transcriptional repressor MraZ [Candidatus Dormibacteraeota bacterium]